MPLTVTVWVVYTVPNLSLEPPQENEDALVACLATLASIGELE